MGCASCASTNGVPKGCGSKGSCLTGGCNKMNTYDWLAKQDLHDPMGTDLVEVSFKQGARKDFFHNHTGAVTGDNVVVDTGGGYDVGTISLSGDLVNLQLKKKKISRDRSFNNIIRIANERDVEKLEEARSLEKNALVKARAIARSLGLEMKMGDVEFQGDKRKATFYYTAEGRIDFRELVRAYAREFKVKIEMRQIGSRQESARIGGIGACGRELCCSTWLSDFKSVSTTAARYQNIAINQTKLSGQCGRLKCCLNYELDTYMDALKGFPKKVDVLHTQVGKANFIKMDIFKGLMFYAYENDRGRGILYPLDKDRVKEIKELNKKGEKPEELRDASFFEETEDIKNQEIDFADDVTGVIELPVEKRRKSRNKKRRKNHRDRRSDNNSDRPKSSDQSRAKKDTGNNNTKDEAKKSDESNPSSQKDNKNKSRRRWRHKKSNNSTERNNKNQKDKN